MNRTIEGRAFALTLKVFRTVAVVVALVASGCSAPAPISLDSATWQAALARIADSCGFTAATKVQVRFGEVAALGPDGETTCNYYTSQDKAEIGASAGTRLAYDAPSISLPLSRYARIDPMMIGRSLAGLGLNTQSWAVVQYEGWAQPYVVTDSAGAGRAVGLDGAVLASRSVDQNDLAEQWELAGVQLTKAGAQAQSVAASVGSGSSEISVSGRTAPGKAVAFIAGADGTPLRRALDPEEDPTGDAFALSAVKPAVIWSLMDTVETKTNKPLKLSSFTVASNSGRVETELILDHGVETVVATCGVIDQSCQVFE